MPKSITSLCANILLLLALFPYLSVTRTSWDTQPWALLWASAVFLPFWAIKSVRLPTWSIVFWVCLAYSILLLYFATDNFLALRSIVGYLSFALFSLIAFKYAHFFSPKVLIAAVAVWFFVVLLQMVVGIDFVRPFLARVTSDASRGLVGLAPEPAGLAEMAVFFVLFALLFYLRNRVSARLLALISLASLIMLVASESGTAVLYIIVAFAGLSIAFVLRSLRRLLRQQVHWYLLLLPIASILLWIVISQMDPHSSRGIRLLAQLSEVGPLGVLARDGSVSDRFGNMVIPLFGLFENYGFGLGPGNWSSYFHHVYEHLPAWLQAIVPPSMGSVRIMSTIGTAIFELGLIGLVLIFTIVVIAVKALHQRRAPLEMAIPVLFLLGTILVMPHSFASPVLGVWVGMFASLSQSQAQQDSLLIRRKCTI